MSGVASIPLGFRPTEPAAAARGYADVGLIGAQTGVAKQQALETAARAGLIGQQEVGAAIANRLTLAEIGALGGLPGMSAPAGPGLIGNAAAAPVAYGGEPSSDAGGGGAGAGGAPPSVTVPPAAVFRPASPYGSVSTPFGVALPQVSIIGAIRSGDLNKGLGEALANRARVMGQALGGATDLNTWNSRVQQLYGSGMLSNDEYLQLYGHPEHRQAILTSLASPDEWAKNQITAAGMGFAVDPNGNITVSPGAVAARGAVAGAEAAAKVPAEIAAARGKPSVRGPTQSVTLLPTGQGPQPLANIASGQPMAGDDWANRSMLTEGGAAGTPATGSSGRGAQSFLDGTWLEQMRAHHPDLTQGKSDAQILAMRGDPALSNQVALEYASDNAPQLAAARLPVNAATLKLAHQLGPAGAIATLQAPEGTPMSRILSTQAIAANPQLAGMTNNQLWGQVVSRFGTGPVQGVGGAPAPAEQPAAGGGGVIPTPGGGGVLPAAMTPGEEQTQKNVANQVTDYQKGLLDKSQAATASNAFLDQMALDSRTWTSGKFADVKMDLLKTIDSIGQNFNALAGKQIWTPSQAVGDWEAFNKNAQQLVRTAVRETSPRAAVQEYLMIAKSLPSDLSSPQAMRQMIDMLHGVNDWYVAKSEGAGALTGRAAPNTFDSQWNKSITPGAFIFHRMGVDDAKHWHDELVKTAQGKAYWDDLVGQVHFLESKGFFAPSMGGIAVGRQLPGGG